MKTQVILLSIIFFILFTINGGAMQGNGKLPSPFCIIPQPQNVVLLKEQGLANDALKMVRIAGDLKRPVMGNILSSLTRSDKPGKGILTLRLDKTPGTPESDEGYVLTVSGGSAEIASKGEAGLFYGCQTLEQLLEDARQYQIPVPSCRITDYPALSYRAVQFDVKHHLNTMNYYYESIDRLARYKINAVIFELEDKLRYKRQPLIAAPQAISIDELAALTRYASERHIEISPLIQGLGHATFILKHQQYAYLRELPWNRWAFCPLHEGTYQVLFDLYSDAIEATPGSKYLHVGGDEIGNIGLCPRCKPTADKEGLMKLNLYWLKRVCEFAEENGRIPIFWDDMPLKYAGVYESTYQDKIISEQAEKIWKDGSQKMDQLLQDFPKNCIYMRWNYSMARQPGNILALDWYKSRGLKVMGATIVSENMRGTEVIKSFMQLAAEKGIIGMLCTAWDDASPHMETRWYGFIAAAEFSWSPDGRELKEYDQSWIQKEFGTSYPGYNELYTLMNKESNFSNRAFFRKGGRSDMNNFLQPMVQLAHWMPPTPDDNKPVDYQSRLIDLPDLRSPGSWIKQYASRLQEAETVLSQHGMIKNALQNLNNSSATNRYHWELYNALVDLNATAPALLIALKQCDTDDKVQLKTGIEKVNSALALFDISWKNLLLVYGKTRFISNPPEYVPDRYFHYASQREDLSWMIQADEMYHGLVKTWLDNITLK